MNKKLLLIFALASSSLLFAQYSGGTGSGSASGTNTAVNLSAFLQGPYSGGSMTTTLNTNNFIPLTQPYSASPWNYSGTESVTSIPSGVVDWVLVELRRNTADSSTVQKRACFILNDGSIVDLDGIKPVNFYKTDDGSYYIVIRHRNHLAVMSANSLSLTSSLSGSYLIGGNLEYDFSTAQTQVFGTNPMNNLGGVFGLISGDGNGDGSINATDRSNAWNLRNVGGYTSNDVDLSGVINAGDRSIIWNNRNISNQVP
jgi:hypothetical protein